MRSLDGELICSATDLVGFAACRHLSGLELAAVRGEIERPHRDDPFVDLLVRRGDAHEHQVLADYGTDHGTGDVALIEIDTRTRAGLEAAAAATVDAMRAGTPVIYQATFFHDGWAGHADFVERVDARTDGLPSALGNWSYQAVDAKLAQRVKPAALLQLADYSEHLTRIQGVAPEVVVVMTGDGARHAVPLADVVEKHRRLKLEFRAAVLTDGCTEATYPDPVGRCRTCRWIPVCDEQRRADDHLGFVAGIRPDQITKLAKAGITTRRALADAPAEPPPAKIAAPVYDRLRRQASLQVRGEGRARPLYELLDPTLAGLPTPASGDLFLDLEGDSMALEGGLEYLFGFVEVLDGVRTYRPFWAHSRFEERFAFEAAVDCIASRRRARPDLHVYHYAGYETTALTRLARLHGTREAELDALLSEGVFVDLYQVVKQSLLLSTESYGLKAVERLYQPERRGAVLDAGASMVAYAEYLADPDPRRLVEIAAYNRSDCESLVLLQAWLEPRRSDSVQPCPPLPENLPPTPSMVVESKVS
jgi:predicted RecB family nuclease